MESISASLCEDVAALRYDDLPAPVLATIKRLLLDTLGLIGGAASAHGIKELNARLTRWETAGSATGLIGKRPYSPPTAALANGAAAHALDFDDLHDLARVHTGCVVLPTILATAEDIGGVSGREFLLAMAIGAELHARLGLTCYNSLGKGWHPTMLFGTLASSLAAGCMLRLQPLQLNNALGIAFHQASGTVQSLHDGTLSKRLGPGFSARAAVLSAFLAKDGMTGTPRALEGSAGLFNLYERNEVKPEFLTRGFGETWFLPEYSFKPYPSCRANHSAIDLAIDLHHNGIRVEDILAVEIYMGNVNWATVGQPYNAELGSSVHAQFNVSYSFASALINGWLDLRSFDKSFITDSRVVQFTKLIKVIDDPMMEPGAIEPARVQLVFKDGRTVEVATSKIRGSPVAPMSDTELQAKFRGCLEFGLRPSEGQTKRLLDAVHHLEKSTDAARSLVEAFPAG